MARICVVLSGCGVFDGAEIHESVICLLALDRAGAEIVMAAPEQDLDVVDHYSGEATGEKRSVLTESARIARGEVKPLRDISAADVDALIFPGGFGAAKNLCDFAMQGGNATAVPEVARIVRDMHAAEKPIGAICIAPAILATVFEGEDFSPRITIGNDEATAEALTTMKAEHVECAVDDIVVDEKNLLVTTPAYMLAGSIKEAALGIEKLVTKIVEMAGQGYA